MSRTSTSRRSETRLSRIDIRSPECSSDVDTSEVRSYISGLFPSVDVRVLRSPLAGLNSSKRKAAAEYLASSRIKDPSRPFAPLDPMYGEIDYELRALAGDARLGGIVYDGRRFQELIMGLLRGHNPLTTATVVLTDRLLSTYSYDDLRHHLRTVVLGFPGVVSVPGMVEASARPKKYYTLKQRLETAGAGPVDPELLKGAFKGKFLEYGDVRMTEVSKGLVLQSVVNHLTLQPFCTSKGCRLFNAHWQEDLLRSQTGSPGLCTRHTKILRQLAKDPIVAW